MKIKRIEHIAIAVNDLKEVASLLQDKFGIALEYEEDRPTTKLAMLPVGETYIELLQGTTPDSGATKWIAENGQSLFHICFEVDAEFVLQQVRGLLQIVDGDGDVLDALDFHVSPLSNNSSWPGLTRPS